jgi:hypothetical protein
MEGMALPMRRPESRGQVQGWFQKVQLLLAAFHHIVIALSDR